LCVGGDRLLVDLGGIVEPADPVEDVRAHVHDVAGARHQRRQAIGVGLGALRRGRGLGDMDVEVDRADMIGVGREDPLDRRDRLADPALGRGAVRLPVIPGRGVHDRIGVQHGDLGIVREARVQLCHGIGIGLIERRPIGSRSGRIAQCQRLDQPLLALA
jgi:hypothetical protein